MAKAKSKEKKKHLTRGVVKAKKAPVWVYLKARNRELIRGRKRHWRRDKLGKEIRKKMTVRKKKGKLPKKLPRKRIHKKKRVRK